MNKAGKYETAFAIMCVICVTVFFVSAAITADLNKAELSEPQTVTVTQLPREKETKDTTYMLIERNGRVYIFGGGASMELTDIEPLGLPEADREKLKQGIMADDRDTLLGLIEDFGS